MKRLFLVALTLAMLIVLAGCNDEANKPSTTPKTDPKETEHTHVWGDWETVTEATCKKKGNEKRVCECGEEETREIALKEHTYTETLTAPTCSSEGYTTYTCVCGDVYTGDEIAKLAHSYNDWYDVKPATCTETGTRCRVCSVCNAFETEEAPTKPHDYTYKAVVTDPTCKDKGYTTYTCVCGDEYIGDETDKAEHSYGDWYDVQEATCTENGTKCRVCSVCNAFETEETPTKPHDYTYKAVVTAPTCIEKGYTTYTCVCGDEYIGDEVDKVSHSYGDWYISTPTTCTSNGEKRCDCNTKGCTQYKTQKILTRGHSYGNWYTFIEPTCSENGEKRRDCSGCSEYKSEVILSHENHSFGEWTTVYEPFCGNVGRKSRTCGNCSLEQLGTIPATGSHSYGSWYSTSDSTVQRDCNNCSAHEMQRTSFSSHATVEAAVTITNKYYAGVSNSVPYRRQGGTFNGFNAYQALISYDESCARIMKKNVVTGETAYSEIRTDMGHANTMSYQSDTNCIHVSGLCFDADTLECFGKHISSASESNTDTASPEPIDGINVSSTDTTDTESVSKPLGNIGQCMRMDDYYRYMLTCTKIEGTDAKYYTYINISDRSTGDCITAVTVDIPDNFEPENISVVNGELYIAACTEQPVVTFYKVIFD